MSAHVPVRTHATTKEAPAPVTSPGSQGRVDALDLLSDRFVHDALGTDDQQAAWLQATSRWLVDASLEGDYDALERARLTMRKHYREALREKADRLAGAIQVLTEVATAGADRTSQSAYGNEVEPGSWAARMLLFIRQNPGSTSSDVLGKIGGSDSQISRAGRDLLGRGLAESIKVGRTVRWSLTNRGRAAAAIIQERATDTELSAPHAPAYPADDPAAHRRWYTGVFENIGVHAGRLPSILVTPPPARDVTDRPDPGHADHDTETTPVPGLAAQLPHDVLLVTVADDRAPAASAAAPDADMFSAGQPIVVNPANADVLEAIYASVLKMATLDERDFRTDGLTALLGVHGSDVESARRLQVKLHLDATSTLGRD